ncbi:MAG TPA: helical backbone metal receptor [Acidimicrobiales bacterium]|nr:helical backbone metal receptor [Acidimicrobiales bacterium]
MVHLSRRCTALLVPLVVVGLASCASTSAQGSPPAAGGGGFPVTIHAADGAVAVPHRPRAIVSLSPTATEMLYAIGAGSQVKAVDKYSDYPEGTPMTALDGNSPNVEAIAGYKPDLVVASQDISGLSSQLKAIGIPVLIDPAATDLAQAYSQFDQLGQATGHVTQARREVAGIKSRIAGIVAATPRPAHPLSYYYELDQTYYSVTSSTFVGQLLGLLGLKSIADAASGAAASGGYPQLNAEFIVKADPDYILLADTLCCGQSAATVAARPGWGTMGAVHDGRVLGLNDDIASRWGPRVVVLLQDVAAELRAHPVQAAA